MKKSILFLFCIIYSAYSQSLSVFDIDPTGFPKIRAKFFAIDKDGKQIINLSQSDFEVKEEGIKRNVTIVSCPAPVPPKALSSVLVMDASGSMSGGNINLAKEAAKAWIEGLPLGKSECAVTAFDTKNYMVQDFTTDKNKLMNAANSLFAQGGTNYDAALLDPMAGGLLITKNGKYKRVIVFLSDGMPNFEPQTSKIIQEAKAQNVTIYGVTLGMPCPQNIKDFTTQTGGIWFENVTTVDQAKKIYQQILQIAQDVAPCTIEWESVKACSPNIINVEIKLNTLGIIANTSYFPPQNAYFQLKLEPYYIIFKNKEVNKKHDTTIKVTAMNGDFVVTNITSSNSFYDINPKTFTLNNGQSINLTISYTPKDSIYSYTKFEFINNLCPIALYSSGTYPKYKSKPQTLKVTHPNGGEVFVVGSDTVITWEGIPKEEIVRLEYSTDNGKKWKYLDTAKGLSYKWKNIPKPASNQCLVKAKQLDKEASGSNEIYTLSGHTDEVMSISFNSDGQMLASGSQDGTIKIWQVSAGIEIRTLSGHSDEVNSVCFSPDGQILASGSDDNKVKLWQVSNGSEIQTLSGFSYDVWSVSISPDGQMLASGSYQEIKLWRVSDGSLIRTLTGHNGWITDIRFSPDGQTLASGCTDNTIKLWQVSDGSLIRTLTGHSDGVWSISFSPDGQTLASGSSDKTIKLWQVSDGSLIRTWLGDKYDVLCVSFSPDGLTLASGGSDNTIKLWQVSDGSLIRTLSGHNYSVLSVSFSPDGQTLASGSADNTVKLWAIEDIELQEDVSDNVFSIVEPIPSSMDIDMGKCIVSNTKDSVVVDFVQNKGGWKFRVDSIYFQGADATVFSLVSGFPEYIVEPNKTHLGEFRFQPKRIGIHQAEIVIITQSDTLIQKIRGEGIEERISIVNTIIDFGKVLVGNEKDTINATTIRNTGSTPITITETRHSYPNDKDFTTIAGGGSFTLQPGETKTMDLRFRPSDVGRTSGTLEFHYSGVGSPAVVQLFGQGIFSGTASAELKTIELSGKPGDIIKVPIILNKEENLSISSVNTIDVDLSFNPTLLYPKDYPIQRIDEKTAKINIKNLPANRSIGEKLGEIEFTVGLGNQEKCDLILSNAVANGGQADITLINGKFNLVGVCREGGARLINPLAKAGIVEIVPNPADEQINLTVELVENGLTEISVFNYFGEKVLEVFKNDEVKLGRQIFNFETIDFSSGYYLIRLTTPTYIESKIIFIMR